MRLGLIGLALAASLALAGCEVIGTIFEVGVWVGVIGVIAAVVLIGYLVSRFRR